MRALPVLPLHTIAGEGVQEVPLSDVWLPGASSGDMSGMCLVISCVLFYFTRPFAQRLRFWTRILRTLLR